MVGGTSARDPLVGRVVLYRCPLGSLSLRGEGVMTQGLLKRGVFRAGYYSVRFP